MIVEIHGMDEERMQEVQRLLLSSEFSRDKEFDKKIRISADTGVTESVNTHRDVFKIWCGHIFLREPGELAITLQGAPLWIQEILKTLRIKYNFPAE